MPTRDRRPDEKLTRVREGFTAGARRVEDKPERGLRPSTPVNPRPVAENPPPPLPKDRPSPIKPPPSKDR